MDYIEQPNRLSYQYVHETIYRKLSDTCAKYRSILPEMECVETTIGSANRQNFFALAMMMIDTLKEHAEKSKAVQEIFDNVRMDFWHGIDPKYPAHQGKYYISSVADEN
jgi:hypothetical protein